MSLRGPHTELYPKIRPHRHSPTYWESLTFQRDLRASLDCAHIDAYLLPARYEPWGQWPNPGVTWRHLVPDLAARVGERYGRTKREEWQKLEIPWSLERAVERWQKPVGHESWKGIHDGFDVNMKCWWWRVPRMRAWVAEFPKRKWRETFGLIESLYPDLYTLVWNDKINRLADG